MTIREQLTEDVRKLIWRVVGMIDDGDLSLDLRRRASLVYNKLDEARIVLLSGHLLKGPQRIALRRASSTEEADLLLMTNTNDGSMAVFSIMRSQQITSPSEYTTDGEFIDVGVDITQIYVVTKRVFNGTTRYFICKYYLRKERRHFF